MACVGWVKRPQGGEERHREILLFVRGEESVETILCQALPLGDFVDIAFLLFPLARISKYLIL